MKPYQRKFIELAMQKEALCFGSFTLKSGRRSPYFFNSGLFNDGESLVKLGQFYADAVDATDLEFDMIYGPAYKGIPLGSAMAIGLQKNKNNYPFCFNRKEIKDHGEGGQTFGAKISGKVLIVDDVISAGTSIRESIEIIESQNGEVAGVIVALDRQEKGLDERCAIQELEQEHNIRVISIVKLEHIIEYLREDISAKKMDSDMQLHLDKIQQYQSEYGTTVEQVSNNAQKIPFTDSSIPICASS